MRKEQLLSALRPVIYRNVPDGTKIVFKEVGTHLRKAEPSGPDVMLLAVARECERGIRFVIDGVVQDEEVTHDQLPQLRAGLERYFDGEIRNAQIITQQLHAQRLFVDGQNMQRLIGEHRDGILKAIEIAFR